MLIALQRTSLFRKIQRMDGVIVLCVAALVGMDVALMPSDHPILATLVLVSSVLLALSGIRQVSVYGEDFAETLTRPSPVTFNSVVAGRALQVLTSIKEARAVPWLKRTAADSAPRKVLLIGPRGTGKRMLAQALANELHVQFIDISTRFFDYERLPGFNKAKDLAKLVQEKAPCVLYFDEATHSVSRALEHLDRLPNANDIVIIVGASEPRQVSASLRTDGKIDETVDVPLPSHAEREELFNRYTVQLNGRADVDTTLLARHSNGLTPAEICEAVNRATVTSAREQAPQLNSNHVLDALSLYRVGHLSE